jgi:hypothetical protein
VGHKTHPGRACLRVSPECRGDARLRCSALTVAGPTHTGVTGPVQGVTHL